MKKIVLVSLAVAAFAAPAFAADEAKMAPAAGTAMTAATEKKVELKDGSWAQIEANGVVKVSKDGGKTWTPAPDGTWEAKDGTKITTKGGKEVK